VSVKGPGIATSPLTAGCPWATENCFQRVVSFGAVKPTPGSTYVFSVAFADSTTQTLSATLAELAVGYPNPASPAPGAVVSTSRPKFSWSAPTSGCVSRYVVLVSDSIGRVWTSGSLAPSAKGVEYNFNGTARLPALTDGSYTWSLFAYDCTGPSVSETRNSARVTGIPFTVSGAPGSYRIRGAVSGLSSAGLVLTTPDEPPITVPAGATSFAFPNLLSSGKDYSVTVLQQPAGQTCSVANGSGTVAGADVDEVQVTCSGSAFTLSGFDAASGRTAVFLIWFTPGVPSTSQILWGSTPALGNASAVNTALVTDHNITIGGLTPDRVYYFQAVSVDALGRSVASQVRFKATQP
jgi:hypothetical protein